MSVPTHESTRRYRYTRAHRLGADKDYQSVFDNKLRQNVGPLSVLAKPNALEHHRLGLTVSRRVGHAVKRHRIKRLLREAFRLNHHAWPGRYDLVAIVHPHQPLSVVEYAECFAKAIDRLHAIALKRQAKQA